MWHARPQMQTFLFLVALVISACSGPSAPSSSPSPAPSPAPAPAPSPSPSPAPAPSSSPASPIELLSSTTTYVAVSSAYHDDATQIAHLVDGDLETAWNGRTGDLTGAFIDVRVPADADVTSIALTAGFTHVTDRADLFTANHRITRVRVTHDGSSAEHALDPDSRELQALPVQGGGGVYRIEITAVLPGSNTGWQEICVSELRVMGHAPGAQAGARYPHLALGALPEASAAPLDVAALAAAYPGEVRWLARAWAEHERAEHVFDATTGDCDDDPVAWNGAQRTRRSILERFAALVEPVDVVSADALRRRAASTRARPGCIEDDRRRHAERGADLAALALALDAAGARVDADARCAWARAHTELLVLRLAESASNEWYLIEYQGEFDPDLPASEGRRQDAAGRVRDQLDGWHWPRSAAGLAPLRRLDRSALPEDGADFAALDAELGRFDGECGGS